MIKTFKWQDIARKASRARAPKQQQKRGSSGKRIAGAVLLIFGLVIGVIVYFYTQYLHEQAVATLGILAFAAMPQIMLIQLGGFGLAIIMMLTGTCLVAMG